MAFANNPSYISESYVSEVSHLPAAAVGCRGAERLERFAASRRRNRSKTLGMILILILSITSLADSAPSQTSRATWITDVTIISPERLDQIEKGSVLIENGRIVRVERGRAGKKPPPGAIVISGEGQYLIPGLIDSHVHVASVPGMKYDPNQSRRQMVQAYFRQLPRSFLYYGYTTLIDLSVFDPGVMDDFRRAPSHPDLYDCGRSLPFANGYPMTFVEPGVRFMAFPNFIYDPKQTARIPSEYKPEDHTAAAAVDRVKSSGGICVKTYFERGFAADKNLPVMGPDVLAEIRKEATRQSLVLMIHANGFEAQKFAVDGNVDVIAHGMWHWGALDRSTELPDEIKRLLDQIAEKRIGYQPTIQVLYGELAYFDPEYLKLAGVAKIIPKEMVRWFETPEGKSFGKELNDDGTPNAMIIKDYEQGPLRRVRQVVAYLASKNANFVFGTDTPSSPTYGNLPGLNGYLEMKQLKEAGMSLAQIFTAATINNARKFKLDAQLGTIEPSKIANLVLMKKSPLESLDAYDSITTIFVHGKAVSRDSLAVNQHE